LIKPWTDEESKALTDAVARSLYINVTKEAEEKKARTARKQAK